MSRKPNILLITTDQQRFDTIAALGNSRIFTPHLDWLCAEGIAFTRAYSDCPVCMPARATIMTGKHGYSQNYVRNGPHAMPLAESATLPGLLTAAGYQTRAQGKMHFHPSRAHYGFEHMELNTDYYRAYPEATRNGLGLNEIVPGRASTELKDTAPHWVVDRSIDFLETRDDTRPFFLWSSFEEPHPPYTPHSSVADLYRNLTPEAPVRGDWDPPAGMKALTWSLSDPDVMGEEALLEMKRSYYALITQVDYALGRLFARMREMNLLEDTWIIFTSDHGELLGDHGLGSKLIHLEGSAHIPMIIRPPATAWPVPEEWGTQCDQLVSLADVLPTCLARAGVPIPEDVDGVDLVALSRSENAEERVHIGDCMHRHFCVLRGHQKLVTCAEGGHHYLFDLEKDPYEQHPLASGEEELLSILVQHLEAQGSPLVQNGQFQPLPESSDKQSSSRYPGFRV